MPKPNTRDAMKRFRAGKAGFTDKAHLKAKGLIPRADGTKKKSPQYEAKSNQEKIAIDTVKNPNKSLLGGPTASEAEKMLRTKFGYTDKQIAKLKEDAPANATGTAVAGTGDDSSTVVVRRKKDKEKMKDRLLRRFKIRETIDRLVPAIEPPTDEVRERVNQLKELALGEAFTSQQIKQAYGILNDPRYKQGNYSGAVSAIEKLAKGLSKHPDVANALRRANEGFASDAQRRAAFASGYKAKGKKKKEEVDLEEGYESNMIAHLGELGIDVSFRLGKMIVYKRDLQKVKDALRDGIADRNSLIYTHRMPDIKTFGEDLEESNVRFGLDKKIIQTLQDKLRKEGGAAGFDDLKKAARSIGYNLTPQALRNTPGIKQHRDGDYILTAGPPIELMLTYGKPGEKVKTYYTKFMQDLIMVEMLLN